MIRYVVATHEMLAKGIKSTVEFLLGKQECLEVVCAYTDECKEPLLAFQDMLKKYPDDEFIFMTDLFGGSVNNIAITLTSEQRVSVVTGVNLALVISLVTANQELDTKTVIENAVESAREAIKDCTVLTADVGEDEF
jgi:mannose/fructose-specific phosphotransferase system component IIA